MEASKRGAKLLAVADGCGLPRAIYAESASPPEVRLVERTIGERFTDAPPSLIIGDKADDCDPLDAELKKLDVELTAPHNYALFYLNWYYTS